MYDCLTISSIFNTDIYFMLTELNEIAGQFFWILQLSLIQNSNKTFPINDTCILYTCTCRCRSIRFTCIIKSIFVLFYILSSILHLFAGQVPKTIYFIQLLAYFQTEIMSWESVF